MDNIRLDGSQIGEFPLPDCWRDKATTQVLFSTFRPRHLNIEKYDTKMKFWKDLIAQYCRFKGKANFSQCELQLQFVCGDQLPACLDTVIAEMQQQKQIRSRSEYEYDPENSWSGWALNSFVKRPLSRGWAKLRHSIVAEDLGRLALLEWIHLDIMDSYCNIIDTKVLEQSRGKLLHLEAFKSTCDSCQLRINVDFLPLCLTTLHARQKVGLEYINEKKGRRIHLIKIPAKVGADLNINESDHAVHNLQITQASLLKQLEELEEQIKANDDRVRQYVKESKRQMAKTYLRKRNLLQKNHERRSIALHNIETLLCSVDEAQSSGVVLDAYKIGSQTLQKVLTESGLKYDNVDEVLADVRETLDQHKEVQDTISNSTVDVLPQEEDELEQELRDLIREAPKTSDNNNDKPEAVTTDEQLIAMLDDLDVEDGSVNAMEVGSKMLQLLK